MLTLYQRTDCPFCWKVRIALVEYGIEFDTVDTVLGEKHPEVTRLSPSGTVPLLSAISNASGSSRANAMIRVGP